MKLAIIGTGHLGSIHTKLAKQIDEIKLVGIFDKDISRAEKAAQEFGTKNFSTLDETLDNCDAVSIVATTSAHHSIAKRALEKGKHVFVEKPITAELYEAEELVKIANEKELTLQVGHIERFNPALIALEKKYELAPKFIQTDRLAQFNPRGTDVAVVLDLMIHDIDIILSLVKSKVKEIHANGIAVVSNNVDIANARIEFENGAVANVTASRISQKKMRKMRMFQRDNYISMDFESGTSEVYRLVSPGDTSLDNFISFGEMGLGDKKKLVVYERPDHVELNALKYELELFADAVKNKKRPVVNGEDGLRALKIAGIIMNKIEEGLKNV